MTSPLVIKMGKISKRRAKQIEQGSGGIADEVSEAMGQVARQLGEEANEKVLLPIVVVYKKKEADFNVAFPFVK